MKKAQWQFTHRPDNQADIKRILREAREDGLTLVEVRGGPEEHRGVYLDAQFIHEHKEYWPKGVISSVDRLGPCKRRDGWTGNYQCYAAADAKRAHEQFCKNLEAASKPREYPPTVSVRAAGPELTPSVAAPAAQQWLPKPGEWFKVSGYLPERSVLPDDWRFHEIEGTRDGKTFQCEWVDKPGECDVSARTIERYGNCIATVGGPVFRSKEWSKIEPAQDPALQQEQAIAPAKRYIPKVGDWFTAKAIKSGALSQIANDPHGQTLICVADLRDDLRFRFFGDSSIWTITKGFYEFRQREKL